MDTGLSLRTVFSGSVVPSKSDLRRRCTHCSASQRPHRTLKCNEATHKPKQMVKTQAETWKVTVIVETQLLSCL
jgi:hypothetical protein